MQTSHRDLVDSHAQFAEKPRRFCKGQEKSRFLKKAAQKLSLSWARGAETTAAQMSKVFCYFLFTKSSLS